jgi:hypothetical protein
LAQSFSSVVIKCCVKPSDRMEWSTGVLEPYPWIICTEQVISSGFSLEPQTSNLPIRA